MWVVDVSMCPGVMKKNKNKITLKINLSHTICNSKNEDTFFSCYLYVVFFYIFAMSHHRTQSNFEVYIYIYIYIYIHYFLKTGCVLVQLVCISTAVHGIQTECCTPVVLCLL